MAKMQHREDQVFLVLAFVIGIYPKPFFQILEQPCNQIVQTVRPDYPLKSAPVERSRIGSIPEVGALADSRIASDG